MAEELRMDTFQRVISATCANVGTPRALTVKLLVEHGEWAQLAQLRTDPNWYSDDVSYFRDVLVTDQLRKCDLPSGIDREGEARELFWALEALNARTNVRLSRYLPETLLLESPRELAVSDFISRWRKEVRRLLGSLPNSLTPRFSSGATFADVGRLITTPDKMSSRPTIYSHSRELVPFWAQTSWGRSVMQERRDSDPRNVRGNIFFTVPKDSKSFRGCCKEASLNVSLQLDLGRLMKTRLKERAGIDLRRGQPVHQLAAKEASITGDHSTIDLSSASDTMCRNVVKLILPSEWYDLLSSLRASHTRIGKKWVRLEKFSSMGNGFTFELETLLFFSLAETLRAGRDGAVLCYGDDLIVPIWLHNDLVAALRFFGFEPNKKKTYAVGPFRESCGGDFFNGVPVRGHFLKELPDEPQKWIAWANGLREVCHVNGILSPLRWEYVRKSWLMILDQIPSAIRRCRGPSSLGDIVIHDEPSRWSLLPRRSSWDPSWELVEVMSYQPIPLVLNWHHWKASVQLASCTLGLPSEGITPRGGVSENLRQ
jgi:hypothetical protein